MYGIVQRQIKWAFDSVLFKTIFWLCDALKPALARAQFFHAMVPAHYPTFMRDSSSFDIHPNVFVVFAPIARRFC